VVSVSSSPYEMRYVVPVVQSATMSAMLGLAFACEVLFGLLLLMVLWKRHDWVIRNSNFPLSATTIVGAMITVASVFFQDPRPFTSYCNVSTFLVVVGSTLLYGCILLKSWRILSISRNKGDDVGALTDRRLFLVRSALGVIRDGCVTIFCCVLFSRCW